MEKLLTLSDVARGVGVSSTAVSGWIRDGVIPAPQFEAAQAKLYNKELYDEILSIIIKRREQRAKAKKESD